MSNAKPIKEEVSFTRTFAAPRALVFKVWTDPKHIVHWWGPKGFTNPVCKIDARPGGAMHIDMKGPDGIVYPMFGEFRDFKEPELLSFVSGIPREDGSRMFEVLTTVTFTEKNGKTTMSMTAKVISKTPGAELHIAGMEQGWSESIDRLVAYIDIDPSAADRRIISTRIFNAPRELVWKAWTEPAHLKNWWGPKGFTNTIHSIDIRPGGVWDFTMHGPNGADYQNKIVFVEFAKPERIVLDHVSHPLFRIHVTFEEIGAKTLTTFRQTFDTVAVYDKVKSFAVPENEENFDKFAAELATMI